MRSPAVRISSSSAILASPTMWQSKIGARGRPFAKLLVTFINLFGEFGSEYWGFSGKPNVTFGFGGKIAPTLLAKRRPSHPVSGPPDRRHLDKYRLHNYPHLMNIVRRTLDIDTDTDARLRQMADERGQDVAAVLAEAVALLDSVVDIAGPDVGEDRRRLDAFQRT